MASAKILVVDDDPAIRTLISRFLSQRGYAVSEAGDGQSAWETFQSLDPDLVILDINLPDTLGYALCEQMQASKDTYILMLTSRADATDKVRGFSQGADDYLTKPFDIIELEHRVQAILRRRRSPAATPQTPVQNFTCGALTIDSMRHAVSIHGEPISLTALEFNLLYFLATHADKVWRRAELIQAVWGYDYVGDQRVVDVHIGQIRRKLEALMEHQTPIKTIRGVGYIFETNPTG
ncbi:two-component response regulator [[Synechococcus] sp. NIES-970]|uniref:response regulator transcription factor n=1 Tax=Picosynechococcus sp. NKBG15041c TaxID=1407650 RepID=UPI0003F7686E|nr:response regulator transcription factor [Picosynechococcus sp. NKBG15041c]BAW96197.1 two-component response regulator [[Synechococcus] sp. NIES-970]